MKQTVLANDGAVGLSFAGEKDQYKIIANVMMMADRIVGGTTSDDAIVSALRRRNIEPTEENIKKVRAFFNE